MDVLAGMTLHRRDWAPSEGVAPHLAQRLIRQVNEDLNTAHSDGRTGEDIVTGLHDGHPTVRSTLDGSLQRLAIDTLRTQLRELQDRHPYDKPRCPDEIRVEIGDSRPYCHDGDQLKIFTASSTTLYRK